jgi:hypothetical protein
MPVKKKTATKKADKKKPQKPKGPGLFDHIKQVNQVQNPRYFKNLSDVDKSTWSNWMILRALSCNPNYTDIVNDLQKFLKLKPELMYLLMIGIFPKDHGYYKFIKGKAREKYNGELIALVAKHFEISEKEAIDYLNIFYLTKENKVELEKIVSLYGKDKTELKELLKV